MAFSLAELFITISADDSPLIMSLRGVHNTVAFTAGAIGDAMKLSMKTGEVAAGLFGRTVSGVFSGVTGMVKSLAGSLVGLAANIASMAGKGILAGVGFTFFEAARGAIELQDAMSATRNMLGDASARVFKYADDVAAAFGIVRQEAIRTSTKFAETFKEFTKSTNDAVIIGNQLTQLGIDLRSTFGGSYEKSFHAVQSAVQGNFRSLRDYGISISAAMVKEEAMRMGLIAKGEAMDEAAKKQATYSLLMSKSKDMQGDLARTQDEAGNQWNKMIGTYENLATTLGTRMLPALTSLFGVGTEALKGLSASFEANKASILSWADYIRDKIMLIPKYWDHLSTSISVTYLHFEEFFVNIREHVVAMIENFDRFGKWIGRNWVDIIKDAANAVVTIFTNMGTNIKNLWTSVLEWISTGKWDFKATPLLEGFKARTEKLPEFAAAKGIEQYEDARKQLWDDLAARDAEREKKADDSKKKAVDVEGTPEFAARKKAADKWKSESFDAADFWEHLRQQSVGGADDTPQQQLAEQKRIREGIDRINQNFKGGLQAKLA